jgi:uncharacterized protein
VDFEWDETKAHLNYQKHGVSFLEATEVFSDDHSYNEERYLLFGVSSKDNHLVVSFTERLETIRIISARQMTR